MSVWGKIILTHELALIVIPNINMKNLKNARAEGLGLNHNIIVRLTVILMAAVVLLPISVTGADSGNEKTQIKLNINSYELLTLEDSRIKIIPGESKIEREAKEKAEAEAKAKAEEIARLRVTAESVSAVSTRSVKTYNDPANFDQIYQRAQDVYDVDWRLLKAIHYIETGCSGSTSKRSYAGAMGPMQFLPSTWRTYGVDGNGDGTADITNVEDAIFTAARYLRACGYPDVKHALWGYNPSQSYYNKVMEVASSLGL